MTPVHFITGGTGFVGSSLILELLLQSDAEIYCLVRGTSEGAELRLHNTLMHVAALYGYPKDMVGDIHRRCHAVLGDLTRENCGVAFPLPFHIDQFWHCAASLAYENRYEEQIFATNVTGTHNAVALAKRLNTRIFNYISTAYVAGTRTGVILEGPADHRETNNLYELSKIEAEGIVTRSTEFRTRIFRPGIVVGHSKTLAAINFSGLYGFLRKLSRFKAVMSRIQNDFVQRETVRMQANPEALLNLVPVDAVAREAIQIGLSDSPAQYFHLTNSTPPTVGVAVNQAFQEVGIRIPAFVTSTDAFSWIDRKFGGFVDFYTSYLVGHKTFDRTNTDAALGTRARGAHLYDQQGLQKLYHWYLDVLEAENAAHQDAKRRAA